MSFCVVWEAVGPQLWDKLCHVSILHVGSCLCLPEHPKKALGGTWGRLTPPTISGKRGACLGRERGYFSRGRQSMGLDL